MNPNLARLHAYPFERLRALLADATPPAHLPAISLSIGEPRHQPPAFVLEALAESLAQLDSYPATRGLPRLRAAMAAALQRRCLPGGEALIDPETMVLPVNGTREALFALVQAVVDPRHEPLVAMPNPGYQIYEGAALLAGAEPYYLNTTAANGYRADLAAVPTAIWRRCQLLFLCSPGNPTGAVLPLEYLRQALTLAERYDFIIAADECYADLYLDEALPCPSLLQAAALAGNGTFHRCIVFHSLSKRSSLPGLRSGLVAGDAALIERFLLYRTYQGCAMPLPTQLASIAAWSDDRHVSTNRHLYQQKFARVLPMLEPVLPLARPDGAFYLWAAIDGDDARFARALYERTNLSVLPGSFMAREAHGENPGRGRVRISLVPELAQCIEAAERLRQFLTG
ncbi:MAG TPA: succinyldiaminopimelate transaminase [Steroidobacteraceae bacterium]|jgi:N-succinyldiaminopimelate aminotransferase|nr:succinyldiaminopimelate transaminase [Steroidobacteraceae bacterium]